MAYHPLGRLFCLFGHHKRSRDHIAVHQEYVASLCRYCGVPLCKFDGQWRIRK